MSTSQKWEPLTTAEAVLQAAKEGRRIETSDRIETRWVPAVFTRDADAYYVRWCINDLGCEYRALVEGGEP